MAENGVLGEEVKNLKNMLPKTNVKVRNSPEKPLFHNENGLNSSNEQSSRVNFEDYGL
jgi:hypothetical protein